MSIPKGNSTTKRTRNNSPIHYTVIQRAVGAEEASYGVYRTGSGVPAEVRCSMYSELDAKEYCGWLNGKRK